MRPSPRVARGELRLATADSLRPPLTSSGSPRAPPPTTPTPDVWGLLTAGKRSVNLKNRHARPAWGNTQVVAAANALDASLARALASVSLNHSTLGRSPRTSKPAAEAPDARLLEGSAEALLRDLTLDSELPRPPGRGVIVLPSDAQPNAPWVTLAVPKSRVRPLSAAGGDPDNGNRRMRQTFPSPSGQELRFTVAAFTTARFEYAGMDDRVPALFATASATARQMEVASQIPPPIHLDPLRSGANRVRVRPHSAWSLGPGRVPVVSSAAVHRLEDAAKAAQRGPGQFGAPESPRPAGGAFSGAPRGVGESGAASHVAQLVRSAIIQIRREGAGSDGRDAGAGDRRSPSPSSPGRRASVGGAGGEWGWRMADDVLGSDADAGFAAYQPPSPGRRPQSRQQQGSPPSAGLDLTLLRPATARARIAEAARLRAERAAAAEARRAAASAGVREEALARYNYGLEAPRRKQLRMWLVVIQARRGN